MVSGFEYALEMVEFSTAMLVLVAASWSLDSCTAMLGSLWTSGFNGPSRAVDAGDRVMLQHNRMRYRTRHMMRCRMRYMTNLYQSHVYVYIKRARSW